MNGKYRSTKLYLIETTHIIRHWAAETLHNSLLLAYLFALSITLAACGPSTQEKSTMNLDTEMIRIDIEGHRFDVPLRYMYSHALATYGRWPTPKKGVSQVGALSLSVLLPDMRPYFEEDDARWTVLGHGEKVEVTVAKGGKRSNVDLIKETEKFIAEGRFYKKALDAYGLIHYTDANKKPYDNGETYFSKNNVLIINCDPEQSPNEPFLRSPGCRIKSNFRLSLVLEYSYSLKYLPQWKEIDDSLKAMFDRFAYTAENL